jgi:hypothetical protein
MRTVVRRAAPVALPLAVLLTGAGAVAAGARSGDAVANPIFFVVLFLVSILGGIVAWRRPDHATGWLLLVAPLPVAVGTAAGDLAVAGVGPVALFANLSLWLAQLGIAAAGSMLLRFPTGTHASRRWRLYERFCYALLIAGILGLIVRPGGVYVAPDVENPLGVAFLQEIGAFLEGLLGLGQVGLILGGALSVILRWRRAAAAERQQIKWVAYSLAVFPLFVALGEIAGAIDQSPEDYASFAFGILGVSLVPASIAMAILRYRLYDIDLIVNRTIVYAVLSAVIAGAYAGCVLLFRPLLDPVTGDNDLAIAASTLAVAALFGPARRRIQSFIDRRFYRSRYDAQQTLERFATRVRDEVDLESLSDSLLHVLEETVKPRDMSLWFPSEGARR